MSILLQNAFFTYIQIPQERLL